ncbi:MAG: hypothetical protein V4659_01880 [Pseudomonadota bacterium]
MTSTPDSPARLPSGYWQHLATTDFGRVDPQRTIAVLPVPGHDHHPPTAFADIAGDISVASPADLASALGTHEGAVLIAGSLYLAGEALRTNAELPD